MRKLLSLFLATILLAAAAFAATTEYALDQKHSTITFSVKHMMVSRVPGKFNQFSGSFHVDEQDPTKSSVKFTIQAASIDTGDEGRDKHLRSADFFEVEKFPEITFESSRIEKRGDGYVAHGTFTMKGVSKQIELPFTLNGPIKGPRGNRYGIEASLTLNRQDYGVAYNRLLEGGGAVVSNDVKVEINLEIVKAQPAPAAQPAAAPSK